MCPSKTIRPGVSKLLAGVEPAESRLCEDSITSLNSYLFSFSFCHLFSLLLNVFFPFCWSGSCENNGWIYCLLLCLPFLSETTCPFI